MALYTLPKKFHVDFRHPKQKPNNEVEIDFSAPVVPNKYCYILNSERPINLVNSRIARREGTNGIILKGSALGSSLKLQNTAGSSSTASARWKIDSVGGTEKGWIMLDFASPQFTTVTYLFAHSDYLAASRMYIFTQTGGVKVRLGSDSSPPLAITSAVAGKRYVILITYANGTFSAFVDGVKTITDDSHTGTAGSSLDATMIGSFDLVENPNLAASNSDFYSLQGGSEELTDAQAIFLTKNPYSTVKPSTKMVYYTPSGPAPTGRIMSSMANGGGLAGRGGIAGGGGGLAG